MGDVGELPAATGAIEFRALEHDLLTVAPPDRMHHDTVDGRVQVVCRASMCASYGRSPDP